MDEDRIAKLAERFNSHAVRETVATRSDRVSDFVPAVAVIRRPQLDYFPRAGSRRDSRIRDYVPIEEPPTWVIAPPGTSPFRESVSSRLEEATPPTDPETGVSGGSQSAASGLAGRTAPVEIANGATHDVLSPESTQNLGDGNTTLAWDAFSAIASAAVTKARLSNYPLALAIVALDETLAMASSAGMGPETLALEITAYSMRHCMSAGDVMGRHGPRSFALLLERTSSDGGFRLAQRILDEVARYIAEMEVPLPFTVTAGIATLPQAGISLAELVRGAEDAVIESNSRGGNQVRMCRASAVVVDAQGNAVAAPPLGPAPLLAQKELGERRTAVLEQALRQYQQGEVDGIALQTRDVPCRVCWKAAQPLYVPQWVPVLPLAGCTAYNGCHCVYVLPPPANPPDRPEEVSGIAQFVGGPAAPDSANVAANSKGSGTKREVAYLHRFPGLPAILGFTRPAAKDAHVAPNIQERFRSRLWWRRPSNEAAAYRSNRIVLGVMLAALLILVVAALALFASRRGSSTTHRDVSNQAAHATGPPPEAAAGESSDLESVVRQAPGLPGGIPVDGPALALILAPGFPGGIPIGAAPLSNPPILNAPPFPPLILNQPPLLPPVSPAAPQSAAAPSGIPAPPSSFLPTAPSPADGAPGASDASGPDTNTGPEQPGETESAAVAAAGPAGWRGLGLERTDHRNAGRDGTECLGAKL